MANDLPIQLPTQTPSIYIFTDNPTLSDARDGTGAAQTVSTWSQNASSPYECTYTIDAIDDPDPESAIPYRTYYEAINFTVESGEQVQTVVRTIDIERASGGAENASVVYTDLVEVYPAITAYASNNQLGSFINIATDNIEMKLKGKGVRWSDIQNVDELKRAIAYRSIQLLSESQIVNGDDKFSIRAQLYKDKTAESLTDVELFIDTNRDGIPDQVAKPNSRYVIVAR